MIDARSIAPDRIRPLKRQEYDRLVDGGAFADERVELLQGALVQMSPQGAKHIEVVKRLAKLLILGLGDRADVVVQSSLALDDHTEPEPDVYVVPPGDYSRVKPSAPLLVVEVAAESVEKDRQLKGRLYAAAGVPEYWLVNLPGRVVEVFTEPSPTGYAKSELKRDADVLSPAAFPDIRITASTLLP